MAHYISIDNSSIFSLNLKPVLHKLFAPHTVEFGDQLGRGGLCLFFKKAHAKSAHYTGTDNQGGRKALYTSSPTYKNCILQQGFYSSSSIPYFAMKTTIY